MSVRFDTAPWIADSIVFGDVGFGVPANTVPETGEHGPALLYQFVVDNTLTTEEVRALITVPTVDGDLFVYEDTSFVYDGPVPASFTIQPYVDGVATGSPIEVDIVEPGGLPAPDNVQAIAQSDTEIQVTWDAVTGATGYEVSRDGGAPVDVGDVLLYDDTGLTASTEYGYRVRAYDGDGPGAYSGTVNATTEAEPVEPPAGTVTIDEVLAGQTAIFVSYSYSAADEDGFEARINNGAPFSITDSPAVIGGLTAETAYNTPGLEIRAVNSAGQSAWSTPQSFTTLAPPEPPGEGDLTTVFATISTTVTGTVLPLLPE
jgi:hypothetical protein